MTMTNIKYAKVKSKSEDEDNQKTTYLDSEEEISLVPPVDKDGDIFKEHIPKHSMKHSIFVTILLILCYFILSIGVTFYQRVLLEEYSFPFSLVIFHLIVKWIMSTVIRIFYRLMTGKQRVNLSFKVSLRKVAPTSFFSAIDIGFSQWGLQIVDVALYTMTKSTAIIFISMFAILFKLEKKSWSLVVIVLMISSGLFLFTYKSTEFHVLGFIFLLIASFSSGARWTMAQLLMQRSKLGLHNPIDMIYYMQGFMIVSLLPFAIIFEARKLWDHVYSFSEMETNNIVMLWLKISVAAFLIFFMEISEFLVLSLTSSLTLSIAGIFKEICQLVLAIKIHNEILSTGNIVGLVLCLGGISSHVLYKYYLLKRKNDPTEFDFGESKNKFNETSKKSTNGTNVVITYKNQKAPLLESESDSDEMDSKSAEILFDILKRRDEVKINT